MSVKLEPIIAVLFDHELRRAAELLHKVLDKSMPEKERAGFMPDAVKAAFLALYAITPDTQAITVISVKDERLAGTRFVDDDETDSSEVVK